MTTRRATGRQPGWPRGEWGQRRIWLALAVLIAALACARPVSARAYEMPRVVIDAVVGADGVLNITEERTFAFDDEVNGVFWTVPIVQNEQGRPSWVDVASIEASLVEDGSARELARTGEAEPGDDGVFTVAEEDDSLRIQLFAPHEADTQATFRLTYALTGAVMAWADTAELYWQFVGPDWDEPAQNVSLTCGLPRRPARRRRSVRPSAPGAIAMRRARLRSMHPNPR